MTVKDNRKTIATTKKAAKKSTKKATKKRNLVIVESPSKAKTIGKFLGSNYKVVASVGHVRDLPKSKIGIDIENDFEPQYINIRGKGDVIKELKKEAKNAKKVFLATDPDREGEAISWHLKEALNINDDKYYRVTFHEVTKDKIKEAVGILSTVFLCLYGRPHDGGRGVRGVACSCYRSIVLFSSCVFRIRWHGVDSDDSRRSR